MNKSAPKTTRRTHKAARVSADRPAPEESTPERRTALLVGFAVLVLITLGALTVYLWGLFVPRGSETRSITYTTEAENNSGVVNSPLSVKVSLPWREGEPQSTIGSVTLHIVDAEGRPARFGPGSPAGFTMNPATDMGDWLFSGSMPSVPGEYRARLTVKRLYGTTQPETVELPQPALVVLEESKEPLWSGYVLTRDGDLWLMASDTSRERRLTYYGGSGAYASNPRWAPDGKLVAFTLRPSRPTSELPRTEIWTVRPDGTELLRRVEPEAEETLSHPAWSERSESLYFAVDRLSNESLPPGTPMSAMNQFRRIDRVDLGTGTRQRVSEGAQWPVTGWLGDELVYLEDVAPPELGGSPREQLIYLRGGKERVVLVNPGTFLKIHAPAPAPGGKWVAFAAYEQASIEKEDSNLLDWLLFKPKVARAHDAPWDIFLVPTRPDAETIKLTNIGEDEPFPVWLDANTLAFMGERALYRQRIRPDGKPESDPIPIREGIKHGEISWFGP